MIGEITKQINNKPRARRSLEENHRQGFLRQDTRLTTSAKETSAEKSAMKCCNLEESEL